MDTKKIGAFLKQCRKEKNVLLAISNNDSVPNVFFRSHAGIYSSRV